MSLWLDQRLARIVLRAHEPMLAQMRLAWWREQLAIPVRQRPAGDPVLDGIASHWCGHEHAMVAAVDGWECLLNDPPLSAGAAQAFARGRAAPFTALTQMADRSAPRVTGDPPGLVWALVDAGLHIRASEDRATLLALAQGLGKPARAARALRGVAVLDALAQRSLGRGGRPLMQGRGAALIATRAAILGW